MPAEEPEFKNETDRLIYEYVRANGFITSEQVQQVTRITTRQGASVALNRLMSKRILRMVSKGKKTYYELENPQYIELNVN